MDKQLQIGSNSQQPMNPDQEKQALLKKIAELQAENQDLRANLAELQSGESLLSIMGDAVPAQAAYLDADTLQFRYANQEAARFFGRSPRELMQKFLPELIGRRNFQSIEPEIEQAKQGVTASQIIKQTGRSPARWTKVSYAPDLDDKGLLRGIIMLAVDITELRHAQESLHSSESLHRTLFEFSPTAITLQDFSKVMERLNQLIEQGVGDIRDYLRKNPEEVMHLAGLARFTYANQATADLYKLSDPKRILREVRQVLTQSDHEHFIDQLVAFAKGEKVYRGEARNLDTQGNILEVMLQKAVLPGYEKDYSQVLVTIIDLTPLHNAQRERERLSMQLQQAQKMEAIGTLAGGIAHDFNNILAVIMGYAELILSTPDNVSSNMSYINQIIQASQKARDLVRQILTFSRKMQADLQPLDLNQKILHAISILERTIPKMVEISTDLDPELPPINADPVQIEQVLINLASNAADAMPEGGSLVFKTAESCKEIPGLPGPGNDYVLLEVKDSGDGMDPDTMEKIFDPFFTTKEVGKGTGLGLSTVFGIIKEHQGHIACQSRPGQGASFFIRLPKVKDVFSAWSDLDNFMS